MNHTYNPYNLYSHLFAAAAAVCHLLEKSCALNFNKLIFAFAVLSDYL